MTSAGEDRPRPSPAAAAGPGLFLVLEGIEGAGKTTQLGLLMEWLRESGLEADHAREPGGTPVGEAVRKILLEGGGPAMEAETELLLLLAARAAFVREVVGPTRMQGRIMVADRFEFSTFAYQGFGRGLPLEELRRLNRFATGGLRPDLVLVLDLPPEEGRARQERMGKGPDRIESEGARFLARIREGYQRLVAEEERAVLVDARPEVSQVQETIRGLLHRRFPETFPAPRGFEEDTLPANRNAPSQ